MRIRFGAHDVTPTLPKEQKKELTKKFHPRPQSTKHLL